MKRALIGIFLFILSIFLGIASLFTTQSISEDILDFVNKTEAYVAAGDLPGAIAAATEMKTNWDTQYRILSSYIPHEHLERCEVAIHSTKRHLELANREAALLLCAEIRVSAQHIYLSEKPAIWNIF